MVVDALPRRVAMFLLYDQLIRDGTVLGRSMKAIAYAVTR